MCAHHVDHQYPQFTVPQQQQPSSSSPQPRYYQPPRDANGYANAQPFVNPAYTDDIGTCHPAQTTPTRRTSIVPAHSVTQETYQSPVVAQPGSDWAKDLIRQAKNSELKKHSLTLQLHTAHILSAQSSLEQRRAKLGTVQAEKDWLESERARLLDNLRQVNEDREKVDLSESAISKEIKEFENQINAITEGEYGIAKKQVDAIRSELGMPLLPSLEATLEEKGASTTNKRRLPDDAEQEGTFVDASSPDPRPTLYSVAQAEAGAAVPVKRGPGRPRKVPVGGTGTPDSASATPEGPSPVKRPRGRPKGSKNKPKLPAEESAAQA